MDRALLESDPHAVLESRAGGPQIRPGAVVPEHGDPSRSDVQHASVGQQVEGLGDLETEEGAEPEVIGKGKDDEEETE